MRPQFGVSQAISFALDQLPSPSVPLIHNVIGNAEDVAALAELNVDKRLSC